MNTKHIHDITFRLCQSLDQNYDVVNMDAVMSVISTLEGTTITKEQLEATRLAKYINHLRRRTKDEHLARRAKSLLKKWREMVGIQQQQQQQTNDPTPNTSSAALLSIAGQNASAHQQQRLRSQSISPAASSTYFDTIPPHSNSNSSQNISGSIVASGTTEYIPCSFIPQHMSNVASGASASTFTRSANHNVHNSNRGFEKTESRSEIGESGSTVATIISPDNRKQPTSFENVLSGFGVMDNSHVGVPIRDNAMSRHTVNKSSQQPHAPLGQTETFIIDQSSNSNSEMSFILPGNSRPAYIAPIVIDIQDSNSGSNLITSTPTNTATTKKIPSTGSSKKQFTTNVSNVTSAISTSTSLSKSKKYKKDKKRRDRGEQQAHEGSNSVIGRKVTTVILDEASSNHQRDQQSGENVHKFTSFVGDGDKSRLTYPEILSLLDNSSMSSMFPLDGSTQPVAEQHKMNLSASNSSHPSFTLSKSDLTFAGKFQKGSAVPPTTTSSNDLIAYNQQRSAASPKLASINNFTSQTATTTTRFRPFRDADCKSNDSNSNSQASQLDLIDVVGRDRMLPTFHGQSNQNILNITQKLSTGAVNTVAKTAISSQKLSTTNTIESTELANITGLPEKKLPRKRGRKKGSKGVDSVIAKETSLSSQMLMTSMGIGVKKVKTTKELYAEMQNRKLGITVASSSPSSTAWPAPQQQQKQISRPASSCSDDGESSTDTMTSEHSRDSAAVPKQMKRLLSIDSNSNSQTIAKINARATLASDAPESSETANQIAAAEKHLLEILQKLPPVPNIAAIELKSTADVVPCTCKINEIWPPKQEAAFEHQIDVDPSSGIVPSKVEPVDAALQGVMKSSAIVGGINENSRINVTNPPKDVLAAPLPAPAKPKKSIFDLDFDDDEDPLHTLKAEAAAATIKQENDALSTENSIIMPEYIKLEVQSQSEIGDTFNIHVKLQPNVDCKLPMDQMLANVEPIEKEVSMPVLPTYEIEEDSLCMAKLCFELQTQKITKFHVDALHNCFIPNVNGNWDNANNVVMQNAATFEEINAGVNMDNEYIITDGCNVVPKYGSLVVERIRKNLSHISFSKNFRPKRPTSAAHLYSIPFLGVARSVLPKYMKRSAHNHKRCHKIIKAALNNQIYENNGYTVPEVTANMRTEEYKTVERELRINTMTKDETEEPRFQTEHCNRTENQQTMQNKDRPNLCVQSLNADTALHLVEPAPFDNNVTLKDITIDVIGHGTDMFLTQSNVTNRSSQNGQNLLVIADHLNFNPNSPVTTSNISAALSKKSPIEISDIELVMHDNQQEYGNNNDAFTKAEAEVAATFITGENVSSRRSSSCSNTSLKQTQQSINLKLRRQFQEQKRLDTNGERNRRRKRCNRHSSVCKSVDGVDNTDAHSKQPRIKRIKIAINGDMATQMQISGGSSNNSSDEYNAEQSTDPDDLNDDHDNDDFVGRDGDNEIDFAEDDENETTVKVAFSCTDDVESLNSGGSQNSTQNLYNLLSVDDELLSLGANIDNIGLDVDYENYGDADVEFDEYEDGDEYSGDYHEVVTRDISAPSTGNNHIVLTIKKTPSKTNSPSNSLSAMSPVIVSNSTNSINTVGTIISPTISKSSAQMANASADADMNAVKEQEAQIDVLNIAPANCSDRGTKPKVPAQIQPKEDIADAADAELLNPENSVKQNDASVIASKNIAHFELNNVENLASSPCIDAVPPPLHNVKCTSKSLQQKRHRRKRTCSIMPGVNSSINFGGMAMPRGEKLHRELFFKHELRVADYDGVKRNILNISSCSSSCAEDSDYDDSVDSENTPHFEQSEIGDLNFESMPDSVLQTCEVKSDYTAWPPQKYTLSTSSVCSTYSSCSTCDSYMKNLETLQYPNLNDADEVTDLGIKPDNNEGDTMMDDNADVQGSKTMMDDNADVQGSKDNDVNCDSTPTVAIAPHKNHDENSHTHEHSGVNKMEDYVDTALPLENNGLLRSFNNIYYAVEQSEGTTRDRLINNGNIVDSNDSTLISDVAVIGHATVDVAKQQEQKLPNENCDDYNNLYNKNTNNINLFSYLNNASSLEKRVNLKTQNDSCNSAQQQQKHNYIHINTNDNNADNDADGNADETEQDFADVDNIINNINFGDTQTAEITDNMSNNSRDNCGKTSSSMQSRCAQIMLPHKEYRTGLRAVDEDVDDDEGNTCARIQQFKEWHQVLQLRSYNDELLTVLPYVVLD